MKITKPEIINIDGITLIYEYLDINRNFALLPIFKTGAIDETDENSGITHFLEHMLSKETKNRNMAETSKILLKYFPRYNAATGFHYMNIICETSIKHIEIGFDFFADIVLNSIFSPEKVEKERKVIEQEIVRYDAENDAIAYSQLLRTMFLIPATKNDVLGDRNNVLKTTSADLEARYKQLVCKENMIFSFAGNTPKEEVITLIKKYFSALPSIPENEIKRPILEFNKEQKIALTKKETERCNVILGASSNVDFTDNTETFCNRILNHYFNRLMGTLWNKLREEKGLVYSFYCSTFTFANKTLNLFEFETSKQNIKDVFVCYAETLRDVYLNGIPKEDFEDIRENFLMMNDSFIPTPFHEAKKNYSTYSSNRAFLTLEETIKLLENLTYEEFSKIIKPTIYSNYLTLSVVGDVEENELITMEELKELFKQPE